MPTSGAKALVHFRWLDGTSGTRALPVRDELRVFLRAVKPCPSTIHRSAGSAAPIKSEVFSGELRDQSVVNWGELNRETNRETNGESNGESERENNGEISGEINGETEGKREGAGGKTSREGAE